MSASTRAQDLQNQFALSNFQRAGLAGDVATLGNLGAFRQGITQQQLQADASCKNCSVRTTTKISTIWRRSRTISWICISTTCKYLWVVAVLSELH